MSLAEQLRALLTELCKKLTPPDIAAPVGPITVTWEAAPADDVPLRIQDIGTCGGWATGGVPYTPQWQEYLDVMFAPEYWPWLEALRAHLLENRKVCIAMGDSALVPILSDGVTKVTAWFSNRGGGDFQAAIWNTHNPENNFNYTDFAWSFVREPK